MALWTAERFCSYLLVIKKRLVVVVVCVLHVIVVHSSVLVKAEQRKANHRDVTHWREGAQLKRGLRARERGWARETRRERERK